LKVGSKSEWKVSTEAGEGLEKIEISGVTTITGKTFYNNPVVNDSCWVIETNSTPPFWRL